MNLRTNTHTLLCLFLQKFFINISQFVNCYENVRNISFPVL